MLDKKSDAVLQLLTEKAGNTYKVLDKSQLVAELPSKLNIDVPSLLNIITFLKENEYVDVKYQDRDEICLSATVKAESYVEGEKVTEKATITNGQISVLMLAMFVAAFIGTLVANIVGKLL